MLNLVLMWRDLCTVNPLNLKTYCRSPARIMARMPFPRPTPSYRAILPIGTVCMLALINARLRDPIFIRSLAFINDSLES